jgi:hyaluronate lyase
MRKHWIMALAVSASLAPGLSQAGDAFDALRQRWQAKLTGPEWLDRQAPEVKALLASQAEDARRAQASMLRAPDAKTLWADTGNFDNPDRLQASSQVTATMRRLNLLARAYATPGSPAYLDAGLAKSLVAGLDWMVREQYSAGRAEYGNWWHWQIGAPISLLDTLTLAHDVVPTELRERCLAAVKWFVPDPFINTLPNGRVIHETGANLLDKALVAILSGMLAKDSARVARGRDGLAPTLEFVTQGDGFYRDGSFIQHKHFAYTGNYGAVALSNYGQLLYLLHGSAWTYSGEQTARVLHIARESFIPLVIDGAMPDAFRGRKIAEQGGGELKGGLSVAASLAVLAELVPVQEATALRGTVKDWIVRSRNFGQKGFGGLPLYEQALLGRLASDPAIEARAAEPGARIFASMDRAVMRGNGFTAVLSLTSPRTGSFETGNGENLKAWWSGMGMLALYDGDGSQFAGNYWPTVDSQRLPGTTTDHSVVSAPKQWHQYPNPAAWVGGASQGRYAALGMAFSMRGVTGSLLQGRKSWFMLGDRILALGSGIEQGQGPTETIVDNRRLADPDGAQLVVDGKPQPNGSKTGARWAWLQDAKAGSQTGYVFPLTSALNTERQQHQGAWADIHTYGSKQAMRNSFQLLSIPHGQPDYAYLLLPNASEGATRAAADAPGMRIEANTAQAAAVYLPQHGVYAANLWQAGSAPRDGQAYVSSTGPAALVLERSVNQLVLTISDPTQQQPSLELTVQQAVGATVSLSPGVTVLSTRPLLRLRIDTAGAAGAGFRAEFSLPMPQVGAQLK